MEFLKSSTLPRSLLRHTPRKVDIKATTTTATSTNKIKQQTATTTTATTTKDNSLAVVSVVDIYTRVALFHLFPMKAPAN